MVWSGSCLCYCHAISMAKRKTAVTILLKHWSYCSLVLSHRYAILRYDRPWYKKVPWASYQIVKLWVAHAPETPRAFSQPPTSKETTSQRSRHASRHVCHTRAVMHVGIANPRWQEKHSRHSWRMRNPQFYTSGKRPIVCWIKFTG